MLHRRQLAICTALLFAAMTARAQTPIGSVATVDADVTAPLQTVGGKTLLRANTTVTAHDHTAEVSLERHGLVLVCATTALQIVDSANNGPLMLSLDRGALELRILARPGDVLLTPDLRIQASRSASLDLHLRVARNGDTCVDNRAEDPSASNAPTVEVHEQFGEGVYLLRPGQHVLFNGGSLRQVVDSEREACGCPPAAAPAAEKYPFPVAQSEGLAPTPPPAPQKPGQTHMSTSTTLQFDGEHPPATQAVAAPPPQKPGIFHRIGHFFHRIFGGAPTQP
jgi:hypothetical protein